MVGEALQCWRDVCTQPMEKENKKERKKKQQHGKENAREQRQPEDMEEVSIQNISVRTAGVCLWRP